MKEFPKIVKAVVAKAKEGDLKAAKMLMDRVIPARKAIEHRQAEGNTGVTIVVQGIAQVEEGKPVIDGTLDTEKLEFSIPIETEEVIQNERTSSSGRNSEAQPE